MRFNHFLSAYYPDTSYGGDRLFANMVEQAQVADHLGFAAVTIPEHHLVNILLTPAPLQMAVKVASETDNIGVTTSVAVLPLHDMRVFAGEVAQADILTNGRLMLGVGRGAFSYELRRMGVDLERTREKFDESLEVLQALLSQEEVSWDGKYYKFDPITVMPRPITKPAPPIMIAALNPTALYHCARRGFSVQTTVLQHDYQHLLDQVNAFREGKAELEADGARTKLSMLQVVYAARDDADARQKVELAHDYYKRFDNVFTGPGQVRNGAIEPLAREQTVDELAENLLICTPDKMIERMSMYQEAGIDEITVNANFGAGQEETIEQMHRLKEDVMPYCDGQLMKQGASSL